MFEKYIQNQKEEMIKDLQSLISIRSVSKPHADGTSKPFGEGPNDALIYFLNLANKLGFRTKNVDGYCGYAEFGEGEELLGIIGHLDVVPEGENWTYPPFSGTVADGKIFGRGAIDDKGPVISSLYAMKAVKNYLEEHNLQLQKRVRLIVGLNEESNWECINYYKAHEEIPTASFSPDADFPCIYAEKSVLTEHFEMDYSKQNSDKIVLEDLNDYQNAINVVPKICSAVLKIDINQIPIQDAITTLQKTILQKNTSQENNSQENTSPKNDSQKSISQKNQEAKKFKFDIKQIGNDKIELTSYGIQAHAAHPYLGVNAISHMIIILNEFCQNYNVYLPLFSFFQKYIGTEIDGHSCGIACEDESGKLTLNVGQLHFNNSATSDANTIVIGLNLRVPVTTDPMAVHDKFKELIKQYSSITLKEPSINKALYLSKEDKLVKTLCKIYNETTNSNEEPIAIGGATYARAFPNCVSFGANLPGQKDMCHQTDEFISIDNLLLASLLYAEAIYELGTNGDGS